MIEVKKIPKDYSPYEKVWISSNIFNGGQVIFEIDENPVFLIGKGEDNAKSRIWLNAPKFSRGKPIWEPVIQNGEILDKSYCINPTDKGTEVTFNGLPLIQFHLDGGELIITLVNLEPINLNIFGGYKSIFVNGRELHNNTFMNVFTMVGIGQKMI